MPRQKPGWCGDSQPREGAIPPGATAEILVDRRSADAKLVGQDRPVTVFPLASTTVVGDDS